jgi:hypothetical protein
MSIIYEAKVRQTRWLAGSRVVVDLHIRNSGSAPFETPDPRYRTSSQPHFELAGPGNHKQQFRPDSRATDWDRGQPPKTLRLAPGQEWKGDLVLSLYADLSAPGHYTLNSWIETPDGRLDSPPSEFEIVQPATRDLVSETSVGEDNSRVVECVELLDGGHVASSLLDERDAANAELQPFEREDRGDADPESTAILAPYSNYSVGLSAVRFIVTESHHKLLVSHNLRPARITAFDGAVISRSIQPVATHAGLYLAALKDADLLLTRFTATDDTLAVGPVWTVEKLKLPPTAAALTVSPSAAGNTLLFVLAWPSGKATQVRFLTVSPQGKVIARADQSIPDALPLAWATAGWSTTGELRATVLVHKGPEIRAVEFRLRPDLSLEGDPKLSQPALLSQLPQDVRLSYFEAAPGRMARMILLRGGGKVALISSTGTAANPTSQVPASGPLAILPGEIRWYAAWPNKGALTIQPL